MKNNTLKPNELYAKNNNEKWSQIAFVYDCSWMPCTIRIVLVFVLFRITCSLSASSWMDEQKKKWEKIEEWPIFCCRQMRKYLSKIVWKPQGRKQQQQQQLKWEECACVCVSVCYQLAEYALSCRWNWMRVKWNRKFTFEITASSKHLNGPIVIIHRRHFFLRIFFVFFFIWTNAPNPSSSHSQFL